VAKEMVYNASRATVEAKEVVLGSHSLTQANKKISAALDTSNFVARP
jgi:hypothetical protein